MNYRLITIAATAAGILCLSTVLPKAQTKAENSQVAQVSKPTPRLPDGQPDLNGMWYHMLGAPAPQTKPGESYDVGHAARTPITLFPLSKPTYKPEFAAKVKDLDVHQIDVDPAWYCAGPGVPRIGPPQKIVQTAKEIVFLYDDLTGNFFRVVRMNGTHRTNIEPSAHGDSIHTIRPVSSCGQPPCVNRNVSPNPAATSHPLTCRNTIRVWASSSQGRRSPRGAQHGGRASPCP